MRLLLLAMTNEKTIQLQDLGTKDYKETGISRRTL
jgi:hypothetical protein